MSLHWFPVQNYANDLIEQSIRTALLQIDDPLPVSTPLIDQFAQEVLHVIIGQSLETVFASTIRSMSDYLTEDIVTDALSIIAEREMHSRSIVTGHGQHLLNTKRRSIDTRSMPNAATCRVGSSSSLTNVFISNHRSPLPAEAISCMVNEMAQRIYMHSIDDLRQ
jgi:hypothetical protein